MSIAQTKQDLLKNVFWIVRSVGERTTESCKLLLERFVPKENIVVIEESPFSKAVRKSYELGIAKGLPWTACIDADVLVLENNIPDFLTIAENCSIPVFCFQGLVMDKFIPIRRPSGIHLYKTDLLEKALPLVPDPGISTRPESTTTQAMKEKGYFTYQTNVVVGLHDYEQFYEDIFRKAFIYAHKHQGVLPATEEWWRRKKENDLDYEVALMGALAGKLYDGTVFIDKEFQIAEAQDLLKFKGIQEKEPLGNLEISASDLEKTYSGFEADEVIQLYKCPRYRENYIRDIPKEYPIHKKALKRFFSFSGRAFAKAGRITNSINAKL